MNRFLIAPSILSADFARLGEEVRAAEAAGADWIHVDVMDGHFVPNLTIGPSVVAALKQVATRPLDVHLMIENPDRYLEAFVEAGAAALGVHVETCVHLHRTLAQIRRLGVRACVVLNPATPAAQIEPVLRDVDQEVDLVVDGGIGLDTVEAVASHGARAFVMGSSFFGSGDYKRFVDAIHAKLKPYEAEGARD